MEKYKWVIALIIAVLLTTMFDMTVFVSDTGNVADAAKSTWKAASSQIKTVINSMVFLAINLVLTVLFFVKVTTAYMDYRKYGQIEQTPVAILFAGLAFSLFAPMYVWQIVGI